MNSELIRSGDLARLSYYTEIEISLFNQRIEDIEAKVDTGSPYTIINLKNTGVAKEDRDKVKEDGVIKGIKDATNHEVLLYPLIVDRFRLTNEIVFDKIKIYFSE